MKPLRIIFFPLISICLLSSCSKEKKFERMLHKSDGAWTIESMTYTLITKDENYNYDTASSTVQNPGVFEFNANEVGAYNFVIENAVHHESFTWKVVSEDALTITRAAEKNDLWTGNSTFLQIAITGDRTDKKEITLTGVETIETETNSGETSSNLTANFMLKKK